MICAEATPAESVSYEAIAEAADRAEALLLDENLRASGAPELVDALDVEEPAPGVAEAYQPAILARYCAAAGEAMRISVKGSERRARSSLISALSHAEQQYSPELSARIAYRIALVAGQGAANPNARSARRELRAAIEPEMDRPSPPPGMNDLCAVLFARSIDRETRWYTTQASLDCAFANSRLAGDYRIAALSRLQLARNALAEAERRPVLREDLRTLARQAARAGLGAAAGLSDPGLRFTLTGRLLEAALDAGEGASAEIRNGLALMREGVTDDPGQRAVLHAIQGRVFAAESRIDDAAASYRQALFFESQRVQPLRLADWYLLLAAAEPERRHLHIAQAYRALETVRPLLPLADPVTEESTFALRMQPVFKAAIAAEFEVQRVDAAQQIVETFRQAEIESTNIAPVT